MDLLTLFTIYAFLWGAIWGSFLNVVIYRLPRGLSLVRPGSHCPACKSPIHWYENVPLVSYWLLRGRCRRCGARFSSRYVWVELLTAVLSVMLFLKCAHGRLDLTEGSTAIGPVLVAYLFYFYFLCAAIAIAFIDIELTVIPDHLTLPTAVLGVVAAWAIPSDGAMTGFFPDLSWLDSLIGLLAGAGFVLAVIGVYKLLTGRVGMGGGDATMMAMIGAFLGWQSLMVVLFFASTQGILVAVGAALVERLRGRSGPFLLRGVDKPEYWEQRESGQDDAIDESEDSAEGGDEREEPSGVHEVLEEESVAFGKIGLPFGPFLALAAVEYLFVGHWVHDWLMGGGWVEAGEWALGTLWAAAAMAGG